MPPRPTPDDAAAALVGVAPLISRWIERLLAHHEPPLTVSQYLALRAIARTGASGSTLALQAGVSGPAVSQLLAGLVAAGLLERQAVATDRRRQSLSLTDAGASAYAAAEALLRARVGALLTGMPRPETDALARLLPQVEAMIAGTPPPRRPSPRPARP